MEAVVDVEAVDVEFERELAADAAPPRAVVACARRGILFGPVWLPLLLGFPDLEGGLGAAREVPGRLVVPLVAATALLVTRVGRCSLAVMPNPGRALEVVRDRGRARGE